MPNYLYNGIELPALPEWDKEKYPYALITTEGYYFGYNLYIAEKMELGFGGIVCTTGHMEYKIRGTEFVHYKTYEGEDSCAYGISVWANQDIISMDAESDETFEGSEPVLDTKERSYCICGERRFPAFPEWDKSKYPYALITYDSRQGINSLWLSSKPFHLDEIKSGTMFYQTQDQVSYARFANCGVLWEKYEEETTSSHIWDKDVIEWSNHDIIDTKGLLGEVGSVFFKGSDPVPVPDEPETVLAWKKHDAYKPNTKWDGNTFYRVMGGKWVKQDAYCAPIAYRYNDVELPDINEVWTDKATYPCAIITRGITNGTYYLTVCGDKPYYTEQAHSTEGYEPTVMAPKPFKGFACVGGSWVLNTEDTGYGVALPAETFELIWTNVDVMNKDNGAVYFSASEPPVPVYA